jgi:hypothetical protein
VVFDCGADWHVREGWRKVADEAGASFWLVDTVCSDVELHRRRFEDHGPIWRCDAGQTWEMVDQLRVHFHPHPQAAFIADASRSMDENVESILNLIRGGATPRYSCTEAQGDRLRTFARANPGAPAINSAPIRAC